MARDDIARERIKGLVRILDVEVRRIDEAVTKFESSVSDRFVAGNEFRQSLNDVQTQMATRRELEAFQIEYRTAHSDLLRIVADLRTSVAIGPPEIRELIRGEARDDGRRIGLGISWGVLVAVVGLLLSFLGVLAAIILGIRYHW